MHFTFVVSFAFNLFCTFPICKYVSFAVDLENLVMCT